MGAKVTDAEVLETLDERDNGHVDESLIRLSTGVTLQAKRVPQGLFTDLMARFPEPSPPVVYIPEKGREEENPHDPTYLARVKEKRAKLAKAMSDAAILMGTELLEAPKEFPGPDDPRWLEEMRVLGYDLRSEREKYLAWVKFSAAQTRDDFNAIWEAVGRQSGVIERDVATAVRRFRPKA